jgi:hypothetical protein
MDVSKPMNDSFKILLRQLLFACFGLFYRKFCSCQAILFSQMAKAGSDEALTKLDQERSWELCLF